MLRTAAAFVAAAGIACAAAPAAERLHPIAPGVRVLSVRLGGLTSQPALNRVRRTFRRPIRLVFRGETSTVTPRSLGARAGFEQAVRRALSAAPASRIGLRVTYSSAAVAGYVDALSARYDTLARSARLVGATVAGPRITASRLGLAVDGNRLIAELENELTTGSRAPLVLPVTAVVPRTTSSSFGPVIVINRAAHVLRLYSGSRFVHEFHVATGQSIYPTPSGTFHIVVKQLNPWWYPPTYDSWAKGLKPVPPGPGNPLGTRWMGLSVPGVGIHGTDEPSSIGYSASHGCIRMQIPDAEWLFSHVAVGTPVVIL